MVQAVVKPLSSDWTGLNEKLIATFRAYRRQATSEGKSQWLPVEDSPVVMAPISDANIEVKVNWQSPFENVGADQRFSSFSALLQTGALAPLGMIWDQIIKALPDGDLKKSLQDMSSGRAALQTLEGRSSVTRLSSTQVFNGLPPLQISFTAHFRAEVSPLEEVERPINQLLQWALPRELADDGILANGARGKIQSPWPSMTPTIIGMHYGNRNFYPLVIESAPYPLGGPRDPNGHLVSAQIPMSLATLSAWDASDWAKSMKT